MSARPRCAALTASTGRRCRSTGCWKVPGPSALYCKRHAQEIAAFSDDTRIINATTSRIEGVDPRRMRCRGRTGPAPESVDAITAELRTVRCHRDWLRCRRAVFSDLPAVLEYRRDSAGGVYAHRVNPDLAAALNVARGRLNRIGVPA